MINIFDIPDATVIAVGTMYGLLAAAGSVYAVIVIWSTFNYTRVVRAQAEFEAAERRRAAWNLRNPTPPKI